MKYFISNCAILSLSCAAILVLASCAEGVKARRAEDAQDAHDLIAESVVVCADGNKVRIIANNLGKQWGLVSAWTILDKDGKPLPCQVGQ